MTVVEDRPIMSVNHCLPVLVFYFWRKLQRTLQRGLSAIAEHLVINQCCNAVRTDTYESKQLLTLDAVVAMRFGKAAQQ